MGGALSPAALERIERIAASGRWVPAFLDLKIAARQLAAWTRPTTRRPWPPLTCWPSSSTGCSPAAASSGPPARCDRSAEILYTWAEQSDFARPFVENPADRSHVVGTIDFVDAVDAAAVAAVLRANGIVDTEPYRKLGRNQLRIAMFPAIEPDDVAALCGCINHVVGALAN